MKRYAALALLASLTAAPALADQVQIYGRAHVSVDYLDDGNDAGLNTSSNASRIGFRANQELRPGLRAIMQVEQAFRMDNGSGSWATRDTFVGLQGDFGMLRLGYFQSPLMEIRSGLDLFGDQIGDIRNLVTLRDQYGGPAYDVRLRNSVHYRSPAWQGLTLNLHYSTNDTEGASVRSNDDVTSVGVGYRREGLYLVGAFERTGELASGERPQATRLGAQWRHEDWTVMGLAQFARTRSAGDVDTWGAGVSRRVGDMTFRGHVFVNDASVAERDATMWALGADWHLGARALVYFAWARTTNDALASYNMSAGARGSQLDLRELPGNNPSGFSVGLVYDF